MTISKKKMTVKIVLQICKTNWFSSSRYTFLIDMIMAFTPIQMLINMSKALLSDMENITARKQLAGFKFLRKGVV
jgi:hypothetical protein